jgi:F0F1-type ATP synthase assembly protein I
MISFSGKLARQMALALEIPMSPVAGGVVGYFLDRYFETDPVLTIVFGLMGVGAAVVNIVRLVKEMSERQGGA